MKNTYKIVVQKEGIVGREYYGPYTYGAALRELRERGWEQQGARFVHWTYRDMRADLEPIEHLESPENLPGEKKGGV